ncbi:hypothetical protein [Halomonas sp. H10-9-1]|uniref:hypothetical protein n=1 Tax=Halomonas sp. H10-9-1 TaxID=2950871 RepID=UPI0032DF3B23
MRIATLGPEGSNHALIAKRYLTQRAGAEGEVCLYATFPEAFEGLLAGRVDRVLQCTAHFSHADCVGRTMHRAFPVDAFVAGSRPLALLARTEVESPSRVGLQPATRYYTGLAAFAEQHDYPSIVAVEEALLAGEVEAGICAREALERHPGSLRLMEDLGPALDVWVLYSIRPLPGGHPLLLG